VSQYLRHLAARSRGTLDAVHPRVPSRFESSTGSEPVAETDIDTPVTPADRPSFPTPAARSMRPERSLSPAASPAVERARAVSAQIDPESNRPRDIVREAIEARDPAAAFTRPVEAPPPHAEPRDAGALFAALEPSALPAIPPRPAGIQPVTAPFAAHHLRAAATAHTEETIVHVTIGRVDVRAAAEPLAKGSPARRTAPATQGLEDWLAGRARR
jgi:hypothetical protein